MGKNQLEKQRSPKNRGALLKKIIADYFERVGHTVAQRSVDARIKISLESKDYPALKRECEAYVARLKTARAAKRQETTARKTAEHAGNEQKRLLETEQQLRLEILAELAAEQVGRLQAEAHARTVRAQLKETEELRRTERLGGKETVAALELQLRDLTISKAKLKLERYMLFEIFCPEHDPLPRGPVKNSDSMPASTARWRTWRRQPMLIAKMGRLSSCAVSAIRAAAQRESALTCFFF